MVLKLKKIRLKEEINQVIGSRRTITNEDLTKLNYVKNVFKETLRLWPVIPSINRITNEELIIDNIIIPKNTEISVTLFIIKFLKDGLR
jgi:cholesterol 24(S)-hydroxylase